MEIRASHLLKVPSWLTPGLARPWENSQPRCWSQAAWLQNRTMARTADAGELEGIRDRYLSALDVVSVTSGSQPACLPVCQGRQKSGLLRKQNYSGQSQEQDSFPLTNTCGLWRLRGKLDGSCHPSASKGRNKGPLCMA